MAETFGKTDKGVTEYLFTDDNIWMSQLATSGSAGDLATMSVYIKTKDEQEIKCAIYNVDLSLVANGTTEELIVGAAQDGWMHFNFPTPPTVLAATQYVLCFWMEADNYGYYTAGGVGPFRREGLTYGAWPNPIVTPINMVTAQFSIYATYVEAPPPAKKTLVQATLISIPPLIVLPTLGQILKVAGGC